MTGQEWANVIGVANQSALGWYSTISGRPIQTGQPRSVLRDITGTDLGGGPTVLGQTASPLSLIVLVGVLVVGAVLIVKK